MNIKLLTEHHLKFLSLKGGYTGSSESTLGKMPHCWKSHVVAQLCFVLQLGTYRFLNFFFLLYCFGGSIGTGILGICSNMAECRYKEYQTENLAMAISITALHVLSLIHSVYTHLKSIDTEKTVS